MNYASINNIVISVFLKNMNTMQHLRHSQMKLQFSNLQFKHPYFIHIRIAAVCGNSSHFFVRNSPKIPIPPTLYSIHVCKNILAIMTIFLMLAYIRKQPNLKSCKGRSFKVILWLILRYLNCISLLQEYPLRVTFCNILNVNQHISKYGGSMAKESAQKGHFHVLQVNSHRITLKCSHSTSSVETQNQTLFPSYKIALHLLNKCTLKIND